ncbi:MAG: anaerobic ribonucleoside-triphosphate reductase activating protein [Desulfobacterales bacterium]
MRIGGLQKQSFIDYPGKMSCVVFLSGCDFECPYCHNPQLTGRNEGGGQGMPAEEIFDFLAARRGFLEGVVVSGGEPTLHAGLPDFCRRIKEIGYPLKLDTNGSRPAMLARLIREGLVDYVAMDVKSDPERYPACLCDRDRRAEILASVRILLESTIDYEFRTTCARPFVSPEIVERIARCIRGCRRYALQPVRLGGVLRPEFFDGVHPAFSPEEMNALQQAAAPWVRECVLR